jgi:hypothetical protein
MIDENNIQWYVIFISDVSTTGNVYLILLFLNNS